MLGLKSNFWIILHRNRLFPKLSETQSAIVDALYNETIIRIRIMFHDYTDHELNIYLSKLLYFFSLSFIDCNFKQRYIVIYDYGFDAYFFKMFAISICWANLVSKSCCNCLKILLQLLHAEFFVFLNDLNLFSKTRILG